MNVSSLFPERNHWCSIRTMVRKRFPTQSQIKQFVKHNRDWLKKGGNGTFFLFRTGNEFFVAAAYFFTDGRLGVLLRSLSLERVFRAQKRHRLVVKSS